MKIDIHTHILPRDIPKWKDKFGYDGFIELNHDTSGGCTRMVRDNGKFFREVKTNCFDPAARLPEMDQCGVGVQVISTVPVMFTYWTEPEHGLEIAQFLNDDIAASVAKFPRRYIGLGTLPMQDPKLAVRELERCMKELGFAGVQIGSHVNKWNLNAPELFEVFEAAQDLNASIFIHPWDMMGKKKMKKYWLPWLVGMPAEVSLAICSMIFGGVFERLPKLRVAFAHGGGAFSATVGRVQHGFDARPDLCAVDNKVRPRDYLGRFFVDSLVHDPDMLQYIIKLYGEDCVALGTDYPFPLGELRAGELIESLKFSEELREKLLWQNAVRWLGMDVHQWQEKYDHANSRV
jgi:aminocarboxymuconate-semialdehyde decarboxylase